METTVLHLAVNEDKKEKLLQQELMHDHAAYYLAITTMTTLGSTTSKKFLQQ